PARAQDAGVLRIYQGNLEVGRETFRDSARRLESTVMIPLLRARIESTLERDSAGRPVRLEERIYALPADTPARRYTATIDGDSIRLAMPGRWWNKAARFDAFAPDQSLAVFLRLVQGAGRSEHAWRLWLPSADSAWEFSVRFSGDTAFGTLGPQAF